MDVPAGLARHRLTFALPEACNPSSLTTSHANHEDLRRTMRANTEPIGCTNVLEKAGERYREKPILTGSRAYGRA